MKPCFPGAPSFKVWTNGHSTLVFERARRVFVYLSGGPTAKGLLTQRFVDNDAESRYKSSSRQSALSRKYKLKKIV